MSTILKDGLYGSDELVANLLPLESFGWNDTGIGPRLGTVVQDKLLQLREAPILLCFANGMVL